MNVLCLAFMRQLVVCLSAEGAFVLSSGDSAALMQDISYRMLLLTQSGLNEVEIDGIQLRY